MDKNAPDLSGKCAEGECTECTKGFIPRAIRAVREAIYHWDIASDRLTWSSNAAEVLGVQDESLLETGRAFASLLDRENITSRFDAVMRSSRIDTGEGAPFSIEYMIRPWGQERDEKAWVEDCGRWFSYGGDKPVEAFGIIRRIDERYQNDQKLHYRGSRDPLTGLMNRSAMGEALDEAIGNAERTGSSCAFLIASVDNFRAITDAYGYDTAEEVIARVGERLKAVARTGDSVARYSESKFGLILHDCRQQDLEVANRRFLAAANERVIETAGGPVWAMLSIGSVVLPGNAGEHNAAIACAEEALAEAGGQPSGAAVIYRPEPDRISRRMLNARCAADIVDSLKQNRFTLAFQPIVNAETGAPVMHEALLRMQDRDGDIIAATHLIPVAEKLGLIRLIDLNVVEMAAQTLKDHEEARLSLNVSGVTATDPGWFRRIVGVLQDVPEIASRLVVEITETVILSELEETGRFISALRGLGCKVAIDDFGSGYTSFRNLKMLDVDIVKLDGVFCDGLAGNEDNQFFVRSLVDLARNIGVQVVAEWVQTEEDAALLREWGVDYLQGHLYGAARIDHPWTSPRLADGAGLAAAVETPAPQVAVETAPAAKTRATDAEVVDAEVADAAEPREDARPPAPAPGEEAPQQPAAPASFDEIMRILDREMEGLRTTLRAMRAQGDAEPSPEPSARAGGG